MSKQLTIKNKIVLTEQKKRETNAWNISNQSKCKMLMLLIAHAFENYIYIFIVNAKRSLGTKPVYRYSEKCVNISLEMRMTFSHSIHTPILHQIQIYAELWAWTLFFLFHLLLGLSVRPFIIILHKSNKNMDMCTQTSRILHICNGMMFAQWNHRMN